MGSIEPTSFVFYQQHYVGDSESNLFISQLDHNRPVAVVALGSDFG